MFCAPEIFFDLEVLKKNQTRKIGKIHKDINFLCIGFVANCRNIANILYSQKGLKHFGLEI